MKEWNKPPKIKEVFFDDFSQGIRPHVWRALNERWKSQKNNGYSQDNCLYTNDPEQVRKHGATGGLVVICSNGDFAQEADRKRQGGGIVTKRLFGPGKYEVRMKVVPRVGQCSAIWTYFNNWSDSMETLKYSEIDLEAPYGGDYRACTGTTYEKYLNAENKISSSQVIKTAPLNDGRWHVLAFEWRTDEENGDCGVVWYIDGKRVLRIDEAVYYHLTNDIDLGNEQWYQFLGYTDANGVRHGYAGVFDGRGYAIRNFKWDNAGWNAGFFYNIAPEGKVCNLALYGSMTSAGGCVGAISGYMFGTIENLFVDVDIIQTHAAQWCGALYGASRDAANGSKVINCLSVGTVTCTSGRSGLIGSVNYAVETIFTKTFGLKGSVNSIVGETNAQSVKGHAELLSEAELKTASTYAGWDTNIWYIKNGTYPLLKNADFEEPDIPDYPDVEIINTNDVREFDYGIESQRSFAVTCTTVPANSPVVYSLDKEVPGVSINPETGIVTLSKEVNNKAKVVVVITSAENPYAFEKVEFTITNEIVREIATLEDLMALSGNIDVLYNNYKLVADIVLVDEFSPIGPGVGSNQVDDGFKGTFDGNGYTIYNLNMTKTSWNAGFFWSIASEGVVKNLTLKGGAQGVVTIIGGSLAGFLWGTVENCFVDVNVTSNHASQPCGGLVGTACGNYLIENTIYVGTARCSNPEAANGSGFIGSGSKNSVVNCFILEGSTEGVVGFGRLGDSVEPATNCFKSEAELKTASTYEGWDTTVWNIVDGQMPALIKGCTKAE